MQIRVQRSCMWLTQTIFITRLYIYVRFYIKPTKFRTNLKGKSVPLQAWSGPEGSRKLRFPDFVTTTLDGGKVVSLTHRPLLPPGNTPGAHFY